jgi:hypothetical protein
MRFSLVVLIPATSLRSHPKCLPLILSLLSLNISRVLHLQLHRDDRKNYTEGRYIQPQLEEVNQADVVHGAQLPYIREARRHSPVAAGSDSPSLHQKTDHDICPLVVCYRLFFANHLIVRFTHILSHAPLNTTADAHLYPASIKFLQVR